MPPRKPSTSSLGDAGTRKPTRTVRSGGCASAALGAPRRASTSATTRTPREIVTALDRLGARRRRARRREPHVRVGQHLVVPDAERLDPSLLTQRERDEEAQLDQLRIREVQMQLCPQGLVGDLGVPDDGACVGQRRLLPLAELRRLREVKEIVVLFLGEPLPSGLDGALDASVLALDRLRDVDPPELLDGVVADALAERQLPGLREGPDDARIVGPDRLALRP